jgi:hypothetical protein
MEDHQHQLYHLAVEIIIGVYKLVYEELNVFVAHCLSQILFYLAKEELGYFHALMLTTLLVSIKQTLFVNCAINKINAHTPLAHKSIIKYLVLWCAL